MHLIVELTYRLFGLWKHLVLFQCKGGPVRHNFPTEIACCDKPDLCNVGLKPILVYRTTAPQEGTSFLLLPLHGAQLIYGLKGLLSSCHCMFYCLFCGSFIKGIPKSKCWSAWVVHCVVGGGLNSHSPSLVEDEPQLIFKNVNTVHHVSVYLLYLFVPLSRN